MKPTKKDLELINGYLTEDEPFGPIDADNFEDREAHKLLFEPHNKIYGSLHRRPSIVIGRKGSGKTSYLHSVYIQTTYDYIIELETAEIFTQILETISEVTAGPVFAENVARLWENVLYIGFFGVIRNQLPKSSKALKYINDYLAKIGIRDGDTFDDVLWNVAEIISEQQKGKTSGLIASILKKIDNVTYRKTKAELYLELRSQKKKAIILLDSLDDFQLEFEVVSRAIQGLLKFAGQTNSSNTPVDIRLCLPAELYHKFHELSSNPNKDFSRKLVLYWVASELIVVAAHRLFLYLSSINEEKIIESFRENDKKSARDLLLSIMPESVTGRLMVKEDPLAYILRHTQLLPRHLLIILNSIHSHSKKYNGKDSMKFSEKSICRGISAVEETLVQEIYIAYRARYPSARQVCEQCISELHHKFTLGDLERVFRIRGKKAMGSDDFFEFKRMLIEIGAVGRVLSEGDRYIQAEFEYTTPHSLVTSTDDLLCLHPLFSEIYNAKIREFKPVYPYGSSMDDKDYRAYH